MKLIRNFVTARALAVVLLSVQFRALADDAKNIAITANDQMKYDITAFEVTAGQKVTVTLTNVGKIPKAVMPHNFVLLKAGSDVTAFAAMGMSQATNSYIAPDQEGGVIAKTSFVGPGETESVTFTAPAAGKYDYLCTFPGHVMAGMRGVMTVKQ